MGSDWILARAECFCKRNKCVNMCHFFFFLYICEISLVHMRTLNDFVVVCAHMRKQIVVDLRPYLLKCVTIINCRIERCDVPSDKWCLCAGKGRIDWSFGRKVRGRRKMRINERKRDWAGIQLLPRDVKITIALLLRADEFLLRLARTNTIYSPVSPPLLFVLSFPPPSCHFVSPPPTSHLFYCGRHFSFPV